MKPLLGHGLGGILLAALMGCHAAAAGPLGTSRAQLSRGGEGWEASADIDAQGNAVAVWIQRTGTTDVHDRIWTKTHPSGRSWSAHGTLSRALRTAQNAPVIRVSAAGEAIAIWNEGDGVWTAERPVRGAWGTARLLIAGAASPLFAMNAQGDAALAWGSGVGPGGPTRLKMMRRDAGGSWQAPQIVAQGPTQGSNVIFDHVAIADGTGEVVAAWETYEAHCNPHCTLVNYVLHASRAARGSDTWADSGALNGPLPWSHRARTAVDLVGHAGLVFALDFQGVMLTTQPGPGGDWSAPALVYGTTFAYVTGLASDAEGNVTLAFLDDNGGMGQIVAIVGNLVTGLWHRPVGVSGTDQSVGQAMLASSANGAAILTWTSGNEFFTHNVVRAATRSATFSAWRRPRTISPAGAEQPVPEAVAVNPSGQGIVVFSAFDGDFTVHTEYAVTN